jgi:FKBP-type peptidyl-prolyl cis-trans isomerase
MRLRRFAVALLPLAFTACLEGTDYSTNPYPNIPIEQTTFAASLNVNLAASTKTASGLYYRDLTVGTGAVATSASLVSVYYAGYRTDGSQFGLLASPSAPFSPQLGKTPPDAIPGFEEGIVGMKVGGTRQLIIPPELAYGEAGARAQNGAYVILPNSVLVFTVQLVNVQ